MGETGQLYADNNPIATYRTEKAAALRAVEASRLDAGVVGPSSAHGAGDEAVGMTGEPLRFVVPMPENVTNRRSGGGHWWSAHRDKARYWKRLDELERYYGSMRSWTSTLVEPWLVAERPAAPLERVTVRSRMYLGGAMDEDNAMARHKPLLDWLKKRHYLADDRKKNIVWEGLPEQVVKRDGNYRIELVVTPL